MKRRLYGHSIAKENLVHPAGFEPAAFRFVAECSGSGLSYGWMKFPGVFFQVVALLHSPSTKDTDHPARPRNCGVPGWTRTSDRFFRKEAL